MVLKICRTAEIVAYTIIYPRFSATTDRALYAVDVDTLLDEHFVPGPRTNCCYQAPRSDNLLFPKLSEDPTQRFSHLILDSPLPFGQPSLWVVSISCRSRATLEVFVRELVEPSLRLTFTSREIKSPTRTYIQASKSFGIRERSDAVFVLVYHVMVAHSKETAVLPMPRHKPVPVSPSYTLEQIQTGGHTSG